MKSTSVQVGKWYELSNGWIGQCVGMFNSTPKRPKMKIVRPAPMERLITAREIRRELTPQESEQWEKA